MPSENKIIRQEQLNRYFTKGVVPIRNDLDVVKKEVKALSSGIKLELRDGKPYMMKTTSNISNGISLEFRDNKPYMIIGNEV